MTYRVPGGGGKLIASEVDVALETWFRVTRANGDVEMHCVRTGAGDGQHCITQLHKGDKVESVMAPLFGETKTGSRK